MPSNPCHPSPGAEPGQILPAGPRRAGLARTQAWAAPVPGLRRVTGAGWQQLGTERQVAASLYPARVPPSGSALGGPGGPGRAHPGERCLCLKVTTERASAVPGPGVPVPGRQ